jgi:hypothetical protein
MKALSIRQPWAWLIVRPDLADAARAAAIAAGELKDIENRSWPTYFRGRVLVHASKGMTRAEYEDTQDYLAFHPLEAARAIELPPSEHLDRGGIVGAVTIDVCTKPVNRTSPWHIEGAYGFHLVDAKPTPFVPCRGALNFFDVPSDVAAQLRALHSPKEMS